MVTGVKTLKHLNENNANSTPALTESRWRNTSVLSLKCLFVFLRLAKPRGHCKLTGTGVEKTLVTVQSSVTCRTAFRLICCPLFLQILTVQMEQSEAVMSLPCHLWNLFPPITRCGRKRCGVLSSRQLPLDRMSTFSKITVRTVSTGPTKQCCN